ncbi:hypothetical protein [Marinobacter sp. C2H3]|uniref:hypothetical protein n=1 Tax=Marinobacter sp. C2H3 TaxID=3119003 RepID=UPI00300EE841
MNQTYDTAYQSAVEAMIAEGMDVFLLNGRAVRERQRQRKDRACAEGFMGEELVRSLTSRCNGSLAVSEASAQRLGTRSGQLATAKRKSTIQN